MHLISAEYFAITSIWKLFMNLYFYTAFMGKLLSGRFLDLLYFDGAK